MCVHASILLLIIVESNCISGRALENRPSCRQDCCFQLFHGLAALRCTFTQSCHELLEVYLPRGTLLVPCEDEVNVRIRALLVDDLAVFGNLGEGLAVHFGSVCELSEHLL